MRHPSVALHLRSRNLSLGRLGHTRTSLPRRLTYPAVMQSISRFGGSTRMSPSYEVVAEFLGYYGDNPSSIKGDQDLRKFACACAGQPSV